MVMLTVEEYTALPAAVQSLATAQSATIPVEVAMITAGLMAEEFTATRVVILLSRTALLAITSYEVAIIPVVVVQEYIAVLTV